MIGVGVAERASHEALRRELSCRRSRLIRIGPVENCPALARSVRLRVSTWAFDRLSPLQNRRHDNGCILVLEHPRRSGPSGNLKSFRPSQWRTLWFSSAS
jgi:hypothetical protein